MIKMGGKGLFVGPQFVHLDVIGFARVGGKAVNDAARLFVASGLLVLGGIGNGGIAYRGIVEADRCFDGNKAHGATLFGDWAEA